MQPDLAMLPARLAEAVSADELEQATRFADVTRHFDPRRLHVTLQFDPPADARELCGASRIEQPVAVSPDVHQHTWSVRMAGEDLEDPHGKRIASVPFTTGRWEVIPYLTGRPSGELPGVSSGASPAYDIHERGGLVRAIDVRPISHEIRTLVAADPDARSLLTAMAERYPVWRGGWTPEPATTFVAVYDTGEPVAGAALTDTGAVQICLVRDGFGAPLLDALESVARERGFARLRLDSSAFLYGDELPCARYGYEVGPPYDGDADVEVWTERQIV